MGRKELRLDNGTQYGIPNTRHVCYEFMIVAQMKSGLEARVVSETVKCRLDPYLQSSAAIFVKG